MGCVHSLEFDIYFWVWRHINISQDLTNILINICMSTCEKVGEMNKLLITQNSILRNFNNPAKNLLTFLYWMQFYISSSLFYFMAIINKNWISATPWTQEVNWRSIRRSEDALNVFWTSYVRSIYFLCPGGIFEKECSKPGQHFKDANEMLHNTIA